GVAAAAAGAGGARGVAGARRWSRTPALLTQLFFGIVGIYLLQGDRLEWGVPVVVLAVAGLAALLAPPSLRALTGEGRTPPEQAGREQARREGARPGKTQREGTQREGTPPQPRQPGQARRPRANPPRTQGR